MATTITDMMRRKTIAEITAMQNMAHDKDDDGSDETSTKSGMRMMITSLGWASCARAQRLFKWHTLNFGRLVAQARNEASQHTKQQNGYKHQQMNMFMHSGELSRTGGIDLDATHCLDKVSNWQNGKHTAHQHANKRALHKHSSLRTHNYMLCYWIPSS